MGYQQIETKVWEIKAWLMKRHGCTKAENMIAPLEWYISTGRASTPFLRGFLKAKTFVLGRQLEKEGTYEEAIARIKTKVKEG